jgi:hypothetical protein
MRGTGGNGRQRAATAIPLPLLLAAMACLLPRIAPAQAGPRTDTPRAGELRVTIEPVITTWEREFTDGGHEQAIGTALFTETHPPLVCTAIRGLLTCRYNVTPVFVRQERRVTPLALQFGITDRIAVGVYLPLVRVNTRAGYQLDTLGSPGAPQAAQRLDSILADTTYAFDPIAGTLRRLHFFAGDVEVNAKYRIVESRNYALSGAVVVRLPTGHQGSPNNLFDLSTGDHQTDVELQVAQELTLFDRLWLNALVRAGWQQPGARTRRVGPQSVLLIPHAALATLNWEPGDYLGVDVAPMLRLSKVFGVGLTAGYWTQKRDRYTYRAPQDSIAVATRLGAPVSAAVLDAGTAFRWTRLGVAMTYTGPAMEGSFSIEQTVSGSGGLVPVATVFRIVMRTSRWPF